MARKRSNSSKGKKARAVVQAEPTLQSPEPGAQLVVTSEAALEKRGFTKQHLLESHEEGQLQLTSNPQLQRKICDGPSGKSNVIFRSQPKCYHFRFRPKQGCHWRWRWRCRWFLNMIGVGTIICFFLVKVLTILYPNLSS